MDDDTAAEDWFTADFLEFADSLAGQPIPDLTGDDPDGNGPPSRPRPAGPTRRRRSRQ